MLWLGWDSLNEDNLLALQGTEFEEFARCLVDAERIERWSVRGTEVEGPFPSGHADGGIDLLVSFSAAPVESEAAWVARTKGPRTLLGDGDVGDALVVSCKAGKKWNEHAAEDAKKKSEAVLPVLQRGGRLLLLTTQTRATFERSVPPPAGAPAASWKLRVKQELAAHYAPRAGVPSSELVPRIEVIDGRDLAAYLRALRSPALASRWGERLGVRQEAQLLSYDGWRRRGGNRPSPAWRDDPARAGALDQLVDLLQPGPRLPEDAVLCVVGPPGIGKTRFVEHAFERAGRTALVVASEDPDLVARRFEDNLLAHAPSALFLVDDCTEAEVRRVRRNFIVAATSGGRDTCAARLILVCPSGGAALDEAPECPVIGLAPMSEAPSHEIIRAVASSAVDDAWVDNVHSLTQGYPWFAILVALAWGGDPTPPETPRKAACRALVAGGEVREAKRRARGVLAVMIAHGADWSETTDDQRDTLARAVGLGGRAELEQVIEACEARGVVRRKRRRYVTPFVLEREVWGLLDDDGPDRPVRRLILEHAPERLPKLLDRLRAAGVDDAGIARAARDILEAAFPAEATPASFDASPLLGALRVCSEILPTETLAHLHTLVHRGELEALRAARRMRRPLIAAIRRAQQGAPAFAPLEATLFKLMRAENEAYTDRATALWAGLFLPPPAAAWGASDERFERLSQRCLQGSAGARVAAVRGIVLALAQASARGAPPDEDARRNSAHLWELLLRCAKADLREVAVIAEEALATHLPIALEGGLLGGLEAPLTESLRALSEVARLRVRRSLELERRRRERVGRELDGLWLVVARETGGRTFGERLRERLNAPAAVGAARAAEERDDTLLLHEGLHPPVPQLLSHLDDLTRGVRASGLVILAGRLDARALLLDALVEHARDAVPNTLLALYCVGRAEAGARDDVRGWVEAWAREPSLSLAVLEVVMRLGPDDGLLAVLDDLLRRGWLRAAPLTMLTWGRWARVSPSARDDFLSLLATIDHPDAPAAVVHRLAEGSDPLTPREADALERALAATASTRDDRGLAWEFMRASERLLAAGRAQAVVRALLAALRGEDEPNAELWLLLAACARQAPECVWAELAGALLAPDVAGDRLRQMLGWYDVVAHLPAAALMTWVGEDARRGVTLARVTSFLGDDPPALALSLVERFGGRSTVAEALTDSLLEAPGDERDFEHFYERLRLLAARWADRATGDARVWLSRTVDRLDREVRVRRADAASRRRSTA